MARQRGGAACNPVAPRDAVGREPLLLRCLRLPRWVPSAVGGGLIASLMGLRALLPEPSFPHISDIWSPQLWFFPCMLAVYCVGAPLVLSGALHALAQIQHLAADDRRRLGRELAAPSLRVFLPWMALGVVIHAGISWVMLPDVRSVSWAAVALSKVGLWHALGWIHIFAWAGITGLLVHTAASFGRLGRALPTVDLLDRAPLAPFVQVALRLALVSLVWYAVALFFHVDWSGDRAIAPQMLVLTPLWLATGIGLFLLPLWGVHVRLLAARTAELARVDRAIRGEREALLDSLIAADAQTASTAELIAYRTHAADFSVWPFGSGSLARLGLYLGIPLLGWVGGALVERLLDALLD